MAKSEVDAYLKQVTDAAYQKGYSAGRRDAEKWWKEREAKRDEQIKKATDLAHALTGVLPPYWPTGNY